MSERTGNSAEGGVSRVLNARMRPDLVVVPQHGRMGRSWVVKDPVAMKYVQLRDEEHTVLRMLDGRATMDDVKRQLERECFPARISHFDLQQFLIKLHRANLLVVSEFGQDHPLLQRQQRQRRGEWLSRLMNPLALRFRGVDPAPLLDRLYPLTRGAFTPAALAIGCTLIVAALTLIVVQFQSFAADLPAFTEFVAPGNLLVLALMLVLAKGLHELAHGLTCQHFGGTCHEIGVMLLVFTPCLYCNVSDAWMFPNRWHRIAVSLAGIYAELVLAAICTFLWWFSEPGLLHWACLDLMFVSCISTLLINGNPLLKYDGYYALSDWLGVPNLRQQAGQVVQQFASRWLWGIEVYASRWLPARGHGFLLLYWAASVAYRCIVVVVILWSIHELMSAYQLESMAILLTLMVMAGLLIATVKSAASAVRRARRGNHVRAVFAIGVLTSVLVALLFCPLPAHVRAPAILWPADAHNVYVAVPGTVSEQVSVGDCVTAKQPLARLVNLQLEQQVHALAGRRDLQASHVRHLEMRRTTDPTAGNELPAAREMLSDFTAQLRERESDLQRLTLKSPADGTVLASLVVPRTSPADEQLSAWQGDPLEQRNQGAFLAAGTVLCHVGNPAELEAMLAIDEAMRSQVHPGQRVEIHVRSLGGDAVTGTIVELARGDLVEDSPERIVGPAATLAHAASEVSPQRVYHARVSLDRSDPGLCGVGGTASIRVAPRSVARRTLDYVARTFRFRW